MPLISNSNGLQLNKSPYISNRSNFLNQTLYKSHLSCFLFNERQSSLLHSDSHIKSPKNSRSESESSPVFKSPNNTVGVIAVVSAAPTISFLQKLMEQSARTGQETPPFIACSDPPFNRGNYMEILENLRQKRVFLERSGARCIVMPSRSSHAWQEELVRDCSVPFIHVGECVTKEIIAVKFKPVEAGSNNVRIGILATDGHPVTSFYEKRLQSQGIEVIYPDKATTERTIVPAVAAFKRKDMEGARNLLRIAIQILLVKAVNKIILASDDIDINGILPQNDPLLNKCIDPLDSMVRATIAWSKSLNIREV